MILSAIDDLADTIRPRLDAAGADPRRIFMIPSIDDLRHDFAQLRAAVNSAPNCRLIIIDPINAYVGPSDCHFHSVMRKVLEPLAKLAAEKRIAVLAIAHLRKNDGATIYRAAGSMGFVAAARSVWTICRDNDNPGRHLLLPLKNNLGPAACGLAYSIKSNTQHGGAAVDWHPSPIEVSANQNFLTPEPTDLNAARQWLRKALANGPRAAADIAEEAANYDLHPRTLRRALLAIGGCTQNRGLIEGWWWSIPETHPSAASGLARKAEEDHPLNVAPSPDFPPSAFPLPPCPNPVPLCPLPQINDVKPSPETPHVEESIAFFNNLDGHTRRTGRFSDQFSRRPNQRATKTGNPMLDLLLNDLRASLLTPVPNEQPPQTSACSVLSLSKGGLASPG